MAAEHAAQILPEKCSATDSQKESPFSAVYRKIPIRCRTTLNVGISKHTHKHYTQCRPNVDSDHSVFTKVYIECNFFCLEWVVKQGRFLYFCMAMESGGRKDFILPQKDAKKYGIAPSSLRKHINELEAARFIRAYSGKPTREPNRYEFCLSWKLPPSPLRSHTPMAICSKSVSDGNKGGP